MDPWHHYLISEDEAASFLERVVDHVYCRGIPRFGHRGEFPYEEFVYFDCSAERNGAYCSGIRIKGVKGTKRGYHRVKLVSNSASCF